MMVVYLTVKVFLLLFRKNAVTTTFRWGRL